MDLTTEQRECAAEDLETARDVLDRKGWIQGDMYRPDGYCFIGAIWAATHGQKERRRCAQAVLTAYLQQAYSSEAPNAAGALITHINDHVLRDKQGAMDVLAKAAIATRERVE